MVQISFRTTETLKKELKKTVKKGYYRSMTEALNEALRMLLKMQRAKLAKKRIERIRKGISGKISLTEQVVESHEEQDYS